MRKVLVTGATGKTGSLLVPRLAAYSDVGVRAFVRDRAKAAAFEAAGVDIAVGTFEDWDSVRAAVAGMDTVVLITPPGPHAVEQANAVLTAAKEVGVHKIVRLSAIKASVDGPTDNTRQHGRTDNEILASGLTYVILRPHFFMQNLFASTRSIITDSALYWGMGDGKLGTIDVQDVSDCIERSVTSDQYDNQIWNPTGPESISFYDVADILTEIMGQLVRYVPVSLETVEQSLREAGLSDWQAQSMRAYSKAYSEGWGDYTTDDVWRMTGHPARSFQIFAREILVPAMTVHAW